MGLLTFGLNVARRERATRDAEWARKLEAKLKYVVSSTRREFPWNNTFRLEGDLREAVTKLKENTPQGVLVGSPMLSSAKFPFFISIALVE